MIKINLPNPKEMSIVEFFAQMRIALKSAEKSYEEMIKGVELTEDNTPWINIRLEGIESLRDEIKSETLDIFLDDEDDAHSVSLEIVRL